jgi:hypothetical protein
MVRLQTRDAIGPFPCFVDKPVAPPPHFCNPGLGISISNDPKTVQHSLHGEDTESPHLSCRLHEHPMGNI